MNVSIAIKVYTISMLLGMAVFTYYSFKLWFQFVMNIEVGTIFCVAMIAMVLLVDLFMVKTIARGRDNIRGYYARMSRRSRKR